MATVPPPDSFPETPPMDPGQAPQETPPLQPDVDVPDPGDPNQAHPS